MKKVNKHGHTINGLRKAAGATKDLHDGIHIQIAYNINTGDVLTREHIGDSWTRYNDPEIITVCHAYNPVTMQHIADAIADAIEDIQARREYDKALMATWGNMAL